MARFFKCLSFEHLGVILLIGILFNTFRLLKRNFENKGNQPRFEKNDETIDSLPIPEYSSYKGRLLGKGSEKVTVAFGMVVAVNALNKVTFVDTAREIIRQDPKPRGSRSLVIVLLLRENRKSKIDKVLEAIKRDLARSLSQGYIHLIISPFDSNPETFKKLYKNRMAHNVPKSAAKVNLQLSYLCHYSSLIANNLIMVDSGVKPRPDALEVIYGAIDKMTPRTIVTKFGDTFSERLYSGKHLPKLSSLLYAMAFVGSLDRTLLMFQHTSAYEKKVTLKGKHLYHLQQQQQQYVNPSASITTTMKCVFKDKEDNAYKGTGASWFYNPKKSAIFTIKFDNPILVKRIAIDVGLDSFLRDALVDAVLELSYEKSVETKECINYAIVKSFEESASIEISVEKEEDKSVLNKQIHCIRIRILKDQTIWGAIRTIIVEPQ